MDEKSVRTTSTQSNGRTFFVANPSDSESDEPPSRKKTQTQPAAPDASPKKDRSNQQETLSFFSPKQSRPAAQSNAPTRPLPVPTPLTTNLPPSHMSYNSSRSNPTLSSPSSTSSPAIESTPPPSTPGLSAPSIYEQPSGGDKDRNDAPGSIFSRVKGRFRRGTKGATSSQSPTMTTPEAESFTSASSISTIGLSRKQTSPSEKHLIMVTIDCDNYAAVDIGGAGDAAYIRERIFAKLHVPDEDQSQYSIYRTEVGAFATTQALNDEDLYREATKKGGSPTYFFVSHSSAPAHDYSPDFSMSPTAVDTIIPPPVIPHTNTYGTMRSKRTTGHGSVSSASERVGGNGNGYDASVSDDLDPEWSHSRNTLRPSPSHAPSRLEQEHSASYPISQRRPSTKSAKAGESPPGHDRQEGTSDIHAQLESFAAQDSGSRRKKHGALPTPPPNLAAVCVDDHGHVASPKGHSRKLSNSAAEREKALEASEREEVNATQQWQNENDRRTRAERPPPRIPLPKTPRVTIPASDPDDHSDTSGTLYRSSSRSRSRSGRAPDTPTQPPPVPAVPEIRTSRRDNTSPYNPPPSLPYSNGLGVSNVPRNLQGNTSSSRATGRSGISAANAAWLNSPPPDSRRAAADQLLPPSSTTWARLTKSNTKSLTDLKKRAPKVSPSGMTHGILPPSSNYNTIDISRRDNTNHIGLGFTSILDSRTAPRPLAVKTTQSSLPYNQSPPSHYPYQGHPLHSPTAYSSISGAAMHDSSRPLSTAWSPSRFRSNTHDADAPDGDNHVSPGLSSPRSGGSTRAPFRLGPTDMSIGQNPGRRAGLHVNIAASHGAPQPSQDPYGSPSVVRTPPRSPSSPRHPTRPRTADDPVNTYVRGAANLVPERPSTAGDPNPPERIRRTSNSGTIIPGEFSANAIGSLRPHSIDRKNRPVDIDTEKTMVPTDYHIGQSPSLSRDAEASGSQNTIAFFGTPNISVHTLVEDDEYEDDDYYSDDDSAQGTLWKTPPAQKTLDRQNSGRRSIRASGLGRRPDLTVQIHGVGPPSSYNPPPAAAEPSPPNSASTFVPKPRAGSQRSSTFADKEEQTWAPRPPAEDVYDRLEEYFPGHDLDKPVIDANTGATSPTALQHHIPPPVPDKDRSDKGLVKAKKSIRVVAAEHKRRIDRTSLAESGTMLRKRSTRLWGSKLEEVTSESGKPLPDSPSNGTKTKITWVRGELIGKGTYGRVYLALNATTGEMIAVKQVEIPTTDSDKADERQAIFVKALKSESETLKDLDHPNVVQYLGFEETPECLSIFLEYVPGGSVGSSLLKHGKFDEYVTKSFTSQILTGLQYLHSKRILHRDLKADNILVEPTGICKISDFGISKQTDLMNDHGQNTAMQGTVFWMAPEVIDIPAEGYDYQIDIWSLGCVLHEMWTGERPWATEAAFAVILKVAKSKQPPPLPENLILSSSGQDFRSLCFAPNPQNRPSAAVLRKHSYLELPAGWTFTGFSSAF